MLYGVACSVVMFLTLVIVLRLASLNLNLRLALNLQAYQLEPASLLSCFACRYGLWLLRKQSQQPAKIAVA
jgi:hypothetical protein